MPDPLTAEERAKLTVVTANGIKWISCLHGEPTGLPNVCAFCFRTAERAARLDELDRLTPRTHTSPLGIREYIADRRHELEEGG